MQRGIDPLDRLYETADGWLVIVAPTDDDAARLAEAIDVPFTDDERFATWRTRREHAYELGALLDTTFATRATSEWLERLHHAGIAAAEPRPAQNATFLGDPEHQRSGRAAQVPHPHDGHVREVGTLYRVSGAALPPHRLAPELGAHTDEILTAAGYPRARIDELRERHAIR